MADDNIIRLADLQDAGELPASSEDALALAYAERHAARLPLRRRLVALAALRRRALELRHHAACVRPRAGDLPRSRAGVQQAGRRSGGKDRRRRGAAGPRRSPSRRDDRAMGREPRGARHGGRR